MIISSLFLMKSLVETVILKPFKYKLLREGIDRLTSRIDNNLVLLATLITWIYRLTFRIQKPKEQNERVENQTVQNQNSRLLILKYMLIKAYVFC